MAHDHVRHVIQRMLADARTMATPQDPEVIDFWVSEIMGEPANEQITSLKRAYHHVAESRDREMAQRLDWQRRYAELRRLANAEIDRLQDEIERLEEHTNGST